MTGSRKYLTMRKSVIIADSFTESQCSLCSARCIFCEKTTVLSRPCTISIECSSKKLLTSDCKLSIQFAVSINSLHPELLWELFVDRESCCNQWHGSHVPTLIAKTKKYVLSSILMFLDRRRRGPIGSVLLVIIGCLVGWLVGNAVFSETALRLFF